MTRPAHRKPDREGDPTPSFPTPDQVEGDIKDTVYPAGIAFFVRMEFPIKLGMTLRTKYHSMLFGRNDEINVLNPFQLCYAVTLLE